MRLIPISQPLNDGECEVLVPSDSIALLEIGRFMRYLEDPGGGHQYLVLGLPPDGPLDKDWLITAVNRRGDDPEGFCKIILTPNIKKKYELTTRLSRCPFLKVVVVQYGYHRIEVPVDPEESPDTAKSRILLHIEYNFGSEALAMFPNGAVDAVLKRVLACLS